MRAALSAILLLLISLSGVPLWGAELADLDFDTFESEIDDGLYRDKHWETHRLVRITMKGSPSDMPERMSDALLKLRHQGFAVEGGYLAGPQFDTEVERLRRQGNDNSAEMVLFPLPDGERLARRDFFRSAYNAWTQGKGELLKKIFGMPAGWLSPEEIRFIPKQKHIVLLLVAEGLHNYLLGRKLELRQQSGAKSAGNLPHLVLAAYLYAYISNIDEMMRVKSGGGEVRYDSRKQELYVSPAFSWVTTQTVVEEFVINFALRSSICGLENTTLDIFNVGLDSAFSGFAKSFSERMITSLKDAADDAKRRGDMARARKFDLGAEALIQVFYNVIFPGLKMMQLPDQSQSSRNWSNAGLAAMGGLGVAINWYQSAHQPRNPPDSCGEVLIQFLPRVEGKQN